MFSPGLGVDGSGILWVVIPARAGTVHAGGGRGFIRFSASSALHPDPAKGSGRLAAELPLIKAMQMGCEGEGARESKGSS